VRVLVSGDTSSDAWLELPDWPPPDGTERSFFLRGEGKANSLVGDGRLEPAAPGADEPADRFVFDPADATPAGGVLGLELDALAGDQRGVEARADVLCYTSAALEASLRIAGRPRATLFFASSAPDTDVVARLVELDDTGEALLLAEGVVRGRWREGGAEPRWLEPGRAERIEVVLAPLCAEVAAGARLRLEVSSASLPRWDRNPNTRAEPVLASAEQSESAEQTLFHDAARPSRLELPLLP
jgi:putative CocE/NonD family hydrolase